MVVLSGTKEIICQKNVVNEWKFCKLCRHNIYGYLKGFGNNNGSNNYYNYSAQILISSVNEWSLRQYTINDVPSLHFYGDWTDVNKVIYEFNYRDSVIIYYVRNTLVFNSWIYKRLCKYKLVLMETIIIAYITIPFQNHYGIW